MDAAFTEAVINATGPNASPRIREITASLVKHLHAFARETQLTVDEFFLGLDIVTLSHFYELFPQIHLTQR